MLFEAKRLSSLPSRARSAPAALSCVRRYLMRTEARFVVTLEKNLESSVQTTAKGTMQQAAKPRRLKRSPPATALPSA